MTTQCTFLPATGIVCLGPRLHSRIPAWHRAQELRGHCRHMTCRCVCRIQLAPVRCLPSHVNKLMLVLVRHAFECGALSSLCQCENSWRLR